MKKFLTLMLAFIILFFSANAYAVVKTYTATDESYANEIEKQEMAKKRAVQKAIQAAREKAGVYLKSYVRVENLTLTDEEILAATSINYKIVGEPTFTSEIQELSDKTSVIVWKATVSLNIDDADLKKFAMRDAKDKSKIVQQDERLMQDLRENDKKFKDLIERSKNITSETERKQIKAELDKIDREFLAIQKVAEGVEIYRNGNFDESIKIFYEAIKINLNYDYAYFWRGNSYARMKNYNQSITDYNQAITINPNYVDSYEERGSVYSTLENYEQTIKDYTKAIELDPKHSFTYYRRGRVYEVLQNYENAIKDYTKFIKLDPKLYLSDAYQFRAESYKHLGNYEQAIKDYTQVISLNYGEVTKFNYSSEMKKILLEDANSYNAIIYVWRGDCYVKLKNYQQAIKDYIQAIKLNPNYEEHLSERIGYAYKALGKNAKAEADFAKARELSYNG